MGMRPNNPGQLITSLKWVWLNCSPSACTPSSIPTIITSPFKNVMVYQTIITSPFKNVMAYQTIITSPFKNKM